MKYFISTLSIAIMLVHGYASAQTDLDLDALDQKLQHQLETKMPGWEHRRIQPIEGSKGVLIQTWTMPNRGVRVVVSRAKSAAEAKESLERFMRQVKGQPLSGFGDGAFVWGFDGSDLELRKGRYIFELNAGANVMADSDALRLTPAQRHERQQSELKRIIREFAKHAADAIDDP